MLALLVWWVLHALAGSLIERLDARGSDLAWQLAAHRGDERRLILVDIDEKSLREIGPWPWPRNTQAKLVESLAELGVSQQIFDIVFSQPRLGDDALAQAVRRHRPVLAQVFASQQGAPTQVGELLGALDWPSCTPPFESAHGYVANTPELAMAASIAGHITPRVSHDGVLRHVPAVICYEGQSYPALGLAALLGAGDQRALNLRRGHGWLDAPWQLEGGSVAHGVIPLERNGDLRVSWLLHPDAFVSVSAADVLAKRVPAGLLQNAWVLVGSTGFGLRDVVSTPYGGAHAGLQVHAQVIAALLDGRTPYEPAAARVLQVFEVLFGLALLVWLASSRRPSYLVPLAAVALASLLWLPHAWALTALSLWVGWLSPALMLVLSGLSLGVVEHARSRLESDRLYRHLASYLPAPVAAALANQAPSSAISASEQQACVLFADIRNFSAYVENRPPDEAAAVLHTFFSNATRVVERHGGVLEAFQGDAILAVWLGEATDHARSSLRAAIELLQDMQTCLPDPAPTGLEPLALGIGLECGTVSVGSFGPARRRSHLVMGRAVTVATRLVDMAPELAHPILLGEGMAARMGGGAGLESMGTFVLEGLRVPHHIYAYPLDGAPGLANSSA